MFFRRNKLKGFVWSPTNDLWFRYRNTIEKNRYKIHKFIGEMRSLFCFKEVNGQLAYCRIRSADINIKYFSMHECMKSRKLKGVYLGKQMHPNKDPKNGFVCIGDYEDMKVDERCAKLICDRVAQFNIDECYMIPKEMQEIEPWRYYNECQTS